MVVFLPLFMVSLALIASGHERNVLQIVPEALIRETPGGVVTWTADLAGGHFEPNISRLDSIANSLAERAVVELRTNAFKLRNLSAKACYWVMGISPANGLVLGTTQTRCFSKGVVGAELSLENARAQKLSTGIAEPIRIGTGAVREYVSLVVLLGVAVGGDFGGWGIFFPDQRMEHASVWVPRRDLVL